MISRALAIGAVVSAILLGSSGSRAAGQVLDKLALLDRQTFWDNRDWDWYKAQVPFFESPDTDLDTTYYYRWELLTKHLTYGSPDSGYSFTEFMDRPFWSGAYGAISCPAGHQLAEARWLRDPRIARDYARYWNDTPGAQPRRYSTWLADAIWGVHLVHPDAALAARLLPGLISNYEGWERDHFVPEAGLFWQTGHDDGMEYNINSHQTKDWVRGAPGYRPTLNSYLWADARAIAAIARLAGDPATAARFEAKAEAIKANLQKKLWDPKRRFFFPMSRDDEEKDGFVVKANTLTYQTGRYAGNEHGRELIGYVPWMFGLPDPGYEAAWSFLMDPQYFYAPFGPTVTERHDPQFLVTKTCCYWSGQSWPYATTQTLAAFARLLHDYKQEVVTKDDYARLLQLFARTHRKEGRPYIAEGVNPDTGSWEGYDAYNHSEHYFHSAFIDLVVTGLMGLRPRADDTVEIHPLIPDAWPYCALDDIPYRGHRLSIVWDRSGTRYGFGPGLHLLADGKELASSPTLARLTAPLAPIADRSPAYTVNYAVNNDGSAYPRVSVSHENEAAPAVAIQDGGAWYHRSPPNRWTAEGSPNAQDWCAVDFGVPRRINTVKLYVLDDGDAIRAPARIDLESWDGTRWSAIPGQSRRPETPVGHRANVVTFPAIATSRVRAVLTHQEGARSGLSELEAWGEATPPIAPAPPPEGNLALNLKGRGFPAASASFTSPYDRAERANDGLVVLRPSPNNRWTAYNSPNATDWLEIDFGREQEVGRVVLFLYDDRGGVQPPSSYTVQRWDGQAWTEIADQAKTPAKPAGSRMNTVTFPHIKASKLRVVFVHAGMSRSGVSEIEVWKE